MKNTLYFAAAAVFEIAGCYTFWMWLRLDKSALWLIPGLVSLVLFAIILTRPEAQFAGRAYAAYGGIYIVASLIWLNIIEHARPSPADAVGVVLCLLGAGIIMAGYRSPQL